MRTPTGYEQYAASHLKRPNGQPWADSSGSFCVQLVYEAGGFTGASFDNASVAAFYALQHHGLDPDWTTALPGEFDYYGTGAGHITMRSRLKPGFALMASAFASSLAQGLGYLTPPQYGLPIGHGHEYMGHSPYFRDSTLAAELNPSGGGGTPVLVPTEGDDMEIYGTSSPAVIPAKYLALNAGLKPNLPTYMWIPAGITPRVTQDQNLIALIAQQQFGQGGAGIVNGIAWAQFDLWFDQAVAASSSGTGGTVNLQPVLTAQAALAAQITALPVPQSPADALTLAHQTANTIIAAIPPAAPTKFVASA